jgi:bifunctional non-homologous end joining protein LigD
VPITFVAFDILRREGVDLTTHPYIDRRQELEKLSLDGPAWTTQEAFDDGRALFAAVCKLGLEGVIAKNPLQPLPAARARLGEAQEPELLAARLRD